MRTVRSFLQSPPKVTTEGQNWSDLNVTKCNEMYFRICDGLRSHCLALSFMEQDEIRKEIPVFDLVIF